MDLDDVRQRRVDELSATVTAADRGRTVRRVLLDDGVAEAVLGRHVADARRRRRALLQREVEQRHVDRLSGLDFDLPRTLGRAAAGARLRLGGDDGRDVAGRAQDVRIGQTAARLTGHCLHCNTPNTIDVENGFLRFFILVTFFTFLTFFILSTFLFKKNVGKIGV